MPGNARKKKKLGGVSGGKEEKTHYAWGKVEEEGEGENRRSPASLGIDAMEEERGDLGERRKHCLNPRAGGHMQVCATRMLSARKQGKRLLMRWR